MPRLTRCALPIGSCAAQKLRLERTGNSEIVAPVTVTVKLPRYITINGWDMLGYVGMETMLKCQVCAIGLPHYGACLPLLLEVASELSGPSPSVTGTIRHLRKRWTNRSTLDLTGCVCHTISRTGGRGREYIEASGCAKAGLEALGSGPHVSGRC